MSFDYAGEEAWETSTESLLPVGNFLVTINKAEMTETGGTMGKSPKPQLELDVSNSQGSRRDWIVITPKTVGKVVQVFDACGAQRPQAGEFDPATGALTEQALARLRGQQVGVVIREEASLKDATKMVPRIAGYVQPARITDDMPADSRGLPGPNGEPAPSSSRPADEAESKIPFVREPFALEVDEVWHGHQNR